MHLEVAEKVLHLKALLKIRIHKEVVKGERSQPAILVERKGKKRTTGRRFLTFVSAPPNNPSTVGWGNVSQETVIN